MPSKETLEILFRTIKTTAEALRRDFGLATVRLGVAGPLPPDTVFHRAYEGEFDPVIAMVKLVHFHDAVNVTLPIEQALGDFQHRYGPHRYSGRSAA